MITLSVHYLKGVSKGSTDRLVDKDCDGEESVSLWCTVDGEQAIRTDNRRLSTASAVLVQVCWAADFR